eukprot:UN11869
MSYREMARDVAELLQNLDLRECRILGHSMGGKVAMMLALEHPNLVSQLVVADIAPVRYQHGYDELIDPILALPLDSIQSRADADCILKKSIPEEGLRAFLLQNLVRQSGSWS